MLSHISVLPLLLEWMQGSRSVGRVIRLAADYEGSDRRNRACWQRKPNVQAGGAERAGWGIWVCWQRKLNVLVVEDDRAVGGRQTLWLCGGKRSGRGRQVLFAVEDECACCGKRVCRQGKTSVQAVENERADRGRRACWLWKEYEFHEDVRRAGEGGNVGW